MARRRTTRRGALGVIGGALFAGCVSSLGGRFRPADHANVETVVQNLEIPWDVTFGPDGEVFLSERTGRVRRYAADELETVASPGDAIDAGSVPTEEKETVWWVEGGEGGLLGIALHPEYPDRSWLYAYYTYRRGDEKYNKVVRFDVSDGPPSEAGQPVIDEIPASNVHNGGRIAFGPGGDLWVTTGDAKNRERAQDPGSLAGSVLRVEPDGSPGADNPDLAGDPRVFTYGHRNPQGLAWLPDGTPVITEHGPTGRDEVSRLVAGANYGWPEARREGEYADTNYRPPILSTGTTSWAPSGAVFYTGDDVEAYHERLLFGGLVSQRVWVVTLSPPADSLPAGGQRFDAPWLDDDVDAVAHSMLEDELGRVRQVEAAPDGTLYAITSNRDGRSGEGFPSEGDDRLVRFA